MTTSDDPGSRPDRSPGDRGEGVLGRRRLLAGASAAGALGVAGVVGWRVTTGRRKVRVGASLPLSGQRAPIGVPLRRGLRLSVERANARRGPLDPTLELRVVDDGGRPDAARRAYESLVKTADLLVAPYGSEATAAVLPVVEGAGVPCVAPTAGDRKLWVDGRRWTAQLLNPVDTFLHPALDAASAAGLRSVGFVYRDDGFTPATMSGAIRQARRGGWDVRAAAVYGSTDELGGVMERVLDREPALVVGGGFRPGAPGGGFLPDALALARAHRRADGSARLACWSIGASFPAFADRLGEPADGTLGVTGWKPYVDYPGNGPFVERYADRWGGAPDAHAAQGYAAGQVLARALDRAGGPDTAAVRDALFALETATVFGGYRVDDRGLQTGKENAVVQWQGTTPVVVWPERWRSGDLES
jgi:branched-chain amino acid transport system substrate-binding protein